MNSLFVTRHTPNTRTGRGNRTIGVIRALALLGQVEVAYVELDGGEPDPSLVQHPGIELRRIVPTRSFKRVLLERKARARGVPKEYASVLSCELAAATTEAGSEHFDRIVADGPTAASPLLWLAGKRPIIYNAHNFESAMHAELESWTEKNKLELADFERRVFQSAHESWLPSKRDLEGAAELAPEASLRLVPNVIDVAAIAPVLAPKSHRALFVADYSYEPNRHSARFLINEVMPQVWKRLAHARLMLVGRGLAQSGMFDPRIELHGFVEDLPGVYAAAGCALVPLLESGGSPFKLIEAMAYGLPIVATPLAAGGVEGLVNGVHYLEGEGADGFAAAVVRALGKNASEIGAAARSLAESEYSIEALAKRLAE
ncbi:MAG: glycosyltransferase family 4 protein [Gaiellaceae bacterium]|jgi:glycosyltransferase involved in cell wall biosynthesis